MQTYTYNKAMMDNSFYSQYWPPQHQWKFQPQQFQATPPSKFQATPPPEFQATWPTKFQVTPSTEFQGVVAAQQQYPKITTSQQYQAATQASASQQYQAAKTLPNADSYQLLQYSMTADNPLSTQSSNYPEPLGLKLIAANHFVLPASAIQSHKLLAVSKVLEKYLKLLDESNVGNLAQKLAKEAFFGTDVIIQCTPSGIHGGLPALQ